MTRKEWEVLKASGKLVELWPKGLGDHFVEGFTYFDVNQTSVEREKNGIRAKLIRERILEIINDGEAMRAKG